MPFPIGNAGPRRTNRPSPGGRNGKGIESGTQIPWAINDKRGPGMPVPFLWEYVQSPLLLGHFQLYGETDFLADARGITADPTIQTVHGSGEFEPGLEFFT